MSSAHGVPTAATHSEKPETSDGASDRPEGSPHRIERPQLALGAAPMPGSASDGLDAMLAPRSWREVLALTSIPLLATAYLAPDDPLLLRGHFPWLALLPLLVGVQHGALPGALSSALLVGAGVVHGMLHGATAPAALAAFAGGALAAGVIAGHFRDRAQARLTRLGGEARQSATRLARLARAHAVLKLSHQKLEERLAARSWSLVSAFDDARRRLGTQRSLTGVGEVVLQVLSNHALVQSATLLTLAPGERGRVAFEARARIGNPPPFDTAHLLVQRALDTGRLVALDAESADGGAESADGGAENADGAQHDLLAVAPLATASGRLLGLVLVHEMPFMAFQAENLRGLAALTALLADMLEDRFVEAHPEAALHLSFAPSESAPGVPPASGTREKGEPSGAEHDGQAHDSDAHGSDAQDGQAHGSDAPNGAVRGDERPTEEWLEHELAAGEAEAAAEARSGDFVGTRTGTHRRRGVARSA